MSVFKQGRDTISSQERFENINQLGGEEGLNQALSNVMIRVYGYMFLGLIVTAIVAFWAAGSIAFWTFMALNPWAFFVIALAPFVLIFAFNSALQKSGAGAGVAMFMIFSVLFGLSLSSIFLVYDLGSITSAFVTTCLVFGAMSVYGYVTKRCLNSVGSFMFVGLIGVVIASVVNLFMRSGPLDWAINIIAIIVFLGLTAYDTQKIKEWIIESPSECQSKKIAIRGALTLYLNFVNLFLRILRIMGRRR